MCSPELLLVLVHGIRSRNHTVYVVVFIPACLHCRILPTRPSTSDVAVIVAQLGMLADISQDLKLFFVPI